MSKFIENCYNSDNEELLSQIERTLTYKEVLWDNISPSNFEEVDLDACQLDGHCYKNFYRCNYTLMQGFCQ